MIELGSLHFKGTLRDYQADIVSRQAEYLQDGKMHIVAAPGSGKTILGLELICRLNQRALVLAPTVTIKQQWGQRFADSFLPDAGQPDDYLSFNLKQPGQITCTTYQGLFAAYTHGREESEEDLEEDDALADYTSFDLVSCLKTNNIRTICLDEAHHLRNEWHKALTDVIAALSDQPVTIIALTATPPYDASIEQWQKYTDLCGPIDAQIGVPQLVAAGILCPHQDYVYFSAPTAQEQTLLTDYQNRAAETVSRLGAEKVFDQALAWQNTETEYQQNEEKILEHPHGYMALLCCAAHFGRPVSQPMVKMIAPNGKMPEYDRYWAQTALQFIVDQPDCVGPQLSAGVFMTLAKANLIQSRQVQLETNDRLKRMLAASVSKLDSITAIVTASAASRNKDLRLLILTDYIKKEQLDLVGTDQLLTAIGAVPVFETLRRTMGLKVTIGMLSGPLIILPASVMEAAAAIAAERKISISCKPLNDPAFCQVTTSGVRRQRVALITALFSRGCLQVLIGTKSLLGEGWDAPCVNVLILASFVGSFMLSNQMRGRAMRTDPKQPDKVSAIWHLAAVSPTAAGLKLAGDDWDVIKRRFDCFVGPAYNRDIIESGVERLTVIKPPYTRDGLAEINRQMLLTAADYQAVRQHWKGSLQGSLTPEIVQTAETDQPLTPQGFVFTNVILTIVYQALLYLLRSLVVSALTSGGGLAVIVNLVYGAAALGLTGLAAYRIAGFATTPAAFRTISSCLLQTLCQLGEIKSGQAAVIVRSTGLGSGLYCGLVNATVYEKTLFAQAMAEILSPIENPRYLLIGQTRFFKMISDDLKRSYACPAVIGQNKDRAELLARRLARRTGGMRIAYTRSQPGRQLLLKCRRYSYINANGMLAGQRQRVISQWR